MHLIMAKSAIKKAHEAFLHMHHKGHTALHVKDTGVGHKAPNASKGKGTAFRPGHTKSGPGFPTGHKAKHISHGKG
jgi:hypothetical protein